MTHRTRSKHRSRKPAADQRHLLEPATRGARISAPHLVGDQNRVLRFDDMHPDDWCMPAGWVPARGHDELPRGYGRSVIDLLNAELRAEHGPDRPKTHTRIVRTATEERDLVDRLAAAGLVFAKYGAAVSL